MNDGITFLVSLDGWRMPPGFSLPCLLLGVFEHIFSQFHIGVDVKQGQNPTLCCTKTVHDMYRMLCCEIGICVSIWVDIRNNSGTTW